MAKSRLDFDVESSVEAICQWMRQEVFSTLRRRGAVVGLSGGVDSSVCCALAVRAFGPDKVLGLCMPERDSSSFSLRVGQLVAKTFKIPVVTEVLAPGLQGLGCYDKQLEAIRQVFPEYGEGYKCKITMPPVIESDRLNFVHLVIEDPKGEQRSARMPVGPYLQMVAATNYKQRLRTVTEYYHADRLNYAVIGTPNYVEYDQGFFVKGGDGLADIKPIAHLYKTQVYAIAKHLGVPGEVTSTPPTTDTFSLPQTQEEFYYALPFDKMDVCLHAKNHGVTPEELGPEMGLTAEQVGRVYRDIEAKRKVAKYLHMSPITFPKTKG